MSLMNTVETNNQRIFDAGKQAERDDFWDIFQNYGEGGGVYNNAFSYGKFTDENYNPKYDIIVKDGTTTSDQIFYRAVDITNIKVPMYINSSRFNNVFYGCINLVSIPELHLIETTTYSGAFVNCTALQTLNVFGTIGKNGFNVQWSTKLNKASIESIINALSAKESGLTVTLSQTAVNNAFTAEEWDALETTKSNWNISLV